MERKFNLTFAELCDLLSIKILKTIFIPQHKKEYEKEIALIMEDLENLIKENKIALTADFIRAFMILMLSNRYIWELETKARSGEDQDYSLLRISHATNGIRNLSKNFISKEQGERIDLKIDSTCNELTVNQKMDWSNLFFNYKENQ